MGLNGRVRYALATGVEAFAIDPTTGVIRSAKQLDRESTAYYDIVALGIDRGTPALTSEVSFASRCKCLGHCCEYFYFHHKLRHFGIFVISYFSS